MDRSRPHGCARTLRPREYSCGTAAPAVGNFNGECTTHPFLPIAATYAIITTCPACRGPLRKGPVKSANDTIGAHWCA